MITTARIRTAIAAHHGGMENATDGELRRLWNSLPEATRVRYLEATESNYDDRSRSAARDAEDAEPTGTE